MSSRKMLIPFLMKKYMENKILLVFIFENYGTI